MIGGIFVAILVAIRATGAGVGGVALFGTSGGSYLICITMTQLSNDFGIAITTLAGKHLTAVFVAGSILGGAGVAVGMRLFRHRRVGNLGFSSLGFSDIRLGDIRLSSFRLGNFGFGGIGNRGFGLGFLHRHVVATSGQA